MKTLHGTCLDIAGLGVLLRGKSGTGKSDLALRLLEKNEEFPATLVADDRVCLTKQRGRLIAAAPPVLHALLEVRGLGLIKMPACESVILGLVVDLVKTGDIERLPEFPKDCTSIRGVELPYLRLHAFEASASAKIRMAVRLLKLSDFQG